MKNTTRTGATKVHTRAQLQGALDLGTAQWARALANDLIPPPDRTAGTYSGWHVDELVARREEIIAAIPDDLSEDQLRTALGVDFGQWRRGRDAGLIPGPDRAGYWTRASVADLTADPEAVRARIPLAPWAAKRSAEYLAEATALPVERVDIEQLADAYPAILPVTGQYEALRLFSVEHLQAIPGSEPGRAALGEVVDARLAWMEASLTPGETAASLLLTGDELTRVAAGTGVSTGRFGRYARVDIEALTDEFGELVEQTRRARELGPNQAARHMEISRADLDRLVELGLLGPDHQESAELWEGGKVVDYDVFTLGAVEDCLAVPWIDWDAVRAPRAPGRPSPLAELGDMPVTRAAAIHALAGQVRSEYGIEVWPRYRSMPDDWVIDWEQDQDGHPTEDEFRAALQAHPDAAQYAGEVELSTAVAQVIWWARGLLEPAAAAIVCVSTVTRIGHRATLAEIAVADPATGKLLLNSLVRPDGAEFDTDAAARRFGKRLEAAPTWSKLWPRYRDAVAGRTLLAYDHETAAAAVLKAHEHAGLDAQQLTASAWRSLSEPRAIRSRTDRSLPLGIKSRAGASALECCELLRRIASVAKESRPQAARRHDDRPPGPEHSGI